MNLEIFRLINNLANKNLVLDTIMIFFSKDVPYIFILLDVMIFLAGIIKKDKNYRMVSFNTFIFTVINLTVNFIIGNIYYINRPFVNNKVNLLFPHIADASFPSDHATGTMSIALGIKDYSKLLSSLLKILSLIVGFSRVYVGHHYPFDIIGAYIIVYIIAYLYNNNLKSKVNNLYESMERKLEIGFKKFSRR